MYGSYLMAARERAGLSRTEAAARLGVTPDAVGKIERDDNPASLATLDRMAQAYGCLIGDLLPNSGGGAVETTFQPLASAMLGLAESEIRDMVNLLAAQARLTRDAIHRRAVTAVERETPRSADPYTTDDDARPSLAATLAGIGTVAPPRTEGSRGDTGSVATRQARQSRQK